MKLFKFKLILIIISLIQCNLFTYPLEDKVGILILSPSHIVNNNNNSNYSNNTEVEKDSTSATSDSSEDSAEVTKIIIGKQFNKKMHIEIKQMKAHQIQKKSGWNLDW